MSIVDLSEAYDIPGVFEARQKRSVRIRDSFINVGIDALNEQRLHTLTVSGLAQASGNSVGGFYTRFQDKDAYFRALRVFTIQSIEQEYVIYFNADKLTGKPRHEILESLVDLMVDLFTSRYRGVLRESLLLILEPEDPWAPMRQSALNIVETLQTSLQDAFPEFSDQTAKTRLRFCFQLIVGVLQNDLVNDYHVHSTADDSLRMALKDVLNSYMNSATASKALSTAKVS